jgi:hypothetical protein
MERDLNSAISKFYFDTRNRPKNSAIFLPGLDRLLLIDLFDFHMTMTTAQILSSKVPTMVYIFREETLGIEADNTNCMNYTLFDKTAQKKGTTSDLIASQTPTIRILGPEHVIVDRGIPEDYKTEDGQRILAKLKTFAEFVHKCVYAIRLTDMLSNRFNAQQLSADYFPKAWSDDLHVFADRGANTEGVSVEITRALYLASDAESARQQVRDIWTKYSSSMSLMRNKFYELLGEEYTVE